MSREFKEGLPYKLAGQLFLNKKYFCQWCPAEIEGFRDRRSAAEYRNTGMCQACQDKAFAEEKEQSNRRRARNLRRLREENEQPEE